jgi:hypothetical protein
MIFMTAFFTYTLSHDSISSTHSYCLRKRYRSIFVPCWYDGTIQSDFNALNSDPTGRRGTLSPHPQRSCCGVVSCSRPPSLCASRPSHLWIIWFPNKTPCLVSGRHNTATRFLAEVCLLMRNLNSEPVGSDVHIWSPPPSSVDRAYHKIWGAVKGANRPHDLGGRWPAPEVEER